VQGAANTDWLDAVGDGWKYYYKITAVDFSGNESDPASPGDITGATGPTALPTDFALYQNVPNPFNPVTTIMFDLPERTFVKLHIYDVNGQSVRALLNEEMSPGRQATKWNGKDSKGRNVASGIYFYRLETSRFTRTNKMLLLK
jgi:hypothetical protein